MPQPDWPSDCSVSRKPAVRGLALHSLSEHVQGNHLLQADEIADAVAAEERWLHNFGRRGKWNICLTTGTLVPTNQEKR